MADVTVNYKGAAIAELSASGSATLETAGKFCEDDIEVVYAGGGGQNVKEWTFTNDQGSSAGFKNLVVEDPWLAQHRADPGLVIVVVADSDIGGIPISGSRLNIIIGSNHYIRNASTSARTPQVYVTRSQSTTTASGSANNLTTSGSQNQLFITSDGTLQFYQTSSSLLQNDTYRIIASLQ